MTKSLDAAKAKVQWAEKHFSDFKDIVFGRSTGIDTRPTTVLHYDFQRTHTGPAQILAPSREWRLAFGDAVHQLRSSLDHIVYALVDGRTADRRILRKIDFPIYGREDLFGQSKGVGHLRALLPTDQFREILVSQPFKRCCEAPESDWLWVLHELDNIDKHRPILVVDPRLMIKRRHADGTVSVVKQPLVAGAEGLLPAVTLPADPPELSGQERSIVVVLAETGLRCDNITVRQVWRDMVSEVKAIIDRFERLLL